jgi:hypothetical protein
VFFAVIMVKGVYKTITITLWTYYFSTHIS